MTYIEVPLDTDPQDILADAYDFIQTLAEDWEPSDGQLDVWLLQAVVSAIAETRDVASRVPDSIFRYYGASIASIPPLDEAFASAQTSWTMVDNVGYTIPEGTQVSIPDSDGNPVAFETGQDYNIPSGSVSISQVYVSAIDSGTELNNLGSVGGVVDLLDPLVFVSSISQTTITSGGADAEADDDYLNRLTEELTLLAPRPILPNDFAIFARNIAGVYRSTAIDGYNPSGGTYNNPRMVAVAAIDASGNPVSNPVKAAIDADLQSRREVNFVVNVIDPTMNTVNVTYQVHPLTGNDPATVVNEVNAALRNYLNAATWGTLPGEDPRDWTNVTAVRYLEIAQVINTAAGVDYITSTSGNFNLQTSIGGGALGRVDLTLTGVAPLPAAGTLTGTTV